MAGHGHHDGAASQIQFTGVRGGAAMSMPARAPVRVRSTRHADGPIGGRIGRHRSHAREPREIVSPPTAGEPNVRTGG
jgi:hypothetical protein